MIGTTADGSAALPNAQVGIYVTDFSDNNVIGGSQSQRNIISGNGIVGIVVQNGSNNLIQSNYIGTNAAGNSAIANGSANISVSEGITLLNASQNTIGGSTSALRNVISGNVHDGILLQSVTTLASTPAKAPTVSDESDEAPQITLQHLPKFTPLSNAEISTPQPRSTQTALSQNNIIQGNLIGLAADGLTPLGNSRAGILLADAANNLIGGSSTGSGNLISANNSDGIALISTGTTGNQLQGNQIGINQSQNEAGNAANGIFINGASDNQLGGSTEAEGNIIAYNQGKGIVILDGSQNAMQYNRIYGNPDGGIDLGNDGLTLNDLLDEDNGTNELQNFPELTSLTTDGSSATIVGGLNSKLNTSYHIEFYAFNACSLSGLGEGEFYLDAVDVTTDGETGHAEFTFTSPEALPGVIVTATATDPDGNTSEFFPGISPDDPTLVRSLLTSCQGGPVFKVDNDGNVFADGTYQTPAADLAEMWAVADEKEALQAGDLLALAPDGGVTRAKALPQKGQDDTSDAATLVIGVYATQPGLLGGFLRGGEGARGRSSSRHDRNRTRQSLLRRRHHPGGRLIKPLIKRRRRHASQPRQPPRAILLSCRLILCPCPRTIRWHRGFNRLHSCPIAGQLRRKPS